MTFSERYAAWEAASRDLLARYNAVTAMLMTRDIPIAEHKLRAQRITARFDRELKRIPC